MYSADVFPTTVSMTYDKVIPGVVGKIVQFYCLECCLE